MTMSTSRRTVAERWRPSLKAGFSVVPVLVVLGAAVAIPTLVTDVQPSAELGMWTRGRYFWPKVIAFEAVLFAGWFSAKVLARRVFSRPKMTGGAAVTDFVVLAIGFGLLLALIAASAFVPDDVLGWFIAGGVLVAVATALLQSALLTAAAAQDVGLATPTGGVPSPEKLVALLRAVECSELAQEPETSAEIKRLREIIAHSLPRVGRIASSVTYAAIADEISSLHASSEGVGDAKRLHESCRQIMTLLNRLQVEFSEN